MNMNRSILALIVGLYVIAPAVVKALAYTHFVTPDGSSTSFCTQREPCSLTRAVSLIGSTNMRPGSTVLLQYGSDGIYSQAALTLAGSGTADAPIKFIGEDGVRITGTRVKPDPALWTLVPGRQFTYQVDWDDTGSFAVWSVAQRPPVTTWRPILVDDRLPPFTQSLGRPIHLEFPIPYATRSSLAQVEAQHCTLWSDLANNKVYVHMCHDGPPVAADNLYVGSYGWGTIVVNGDYLWLENLAIEQVPSTALKVNPSANATVLKKIAARASQVWLEGTNTLAEDLDVNHVIKQGSFPGSQCYDANPDFGVGECWNAFGDGRALLIGRAGKTTSSGQVVRRAKIHRSWNGARVDGRHTLEKSTFWGFPNHTLEASGTGGVISHNVFLNGQDSIFLGSNPFDDLTVEHNIFVNSAYFTVSDYGMGGTPPTVGWRFRYNILAGIVFDEKTFSTVESDCNLYINSGVLMRIFGTDGGQRVEYDTLEQIQSRTPLERRSIALPRSKWTDGTLFRHFAGQASAEFDFTPASAAAALEACGRRSGPNILAPAAPTALRIVEQAR